MVRAEAGQCGGAGAGAGPSCLALERRTEDVMELRLGAGCGQGACEGAGCGQGGCEGAGGCNQGAWVTLTRRGRSRGRARDLCPLRGRYSGTLPDGEGLCAR